MSAVFACMIGMYAALTTRFRFEENAQGIENTVKYIHDAKESATEGLRSVSDKVQGFFLHSVVKKKRWLVKPPMH